MHGYIVNQIYLQGGHKYKKQTRKMLTAGLVTAMVLGSVGVSVTDEAKAERGVTVENHTKDYLVSADHAEKLANDYESADTSSDVGEDLSEKNNRSKGYKYRRTGMESANDKCR